MAGEAPGTIRYVLVGMAAGEVARLPAMTLRAAPLRLIGSGTGRQPRAMDAVPAYHELLREAVAGEISIDVDAVPLADVASVWPRADGSRRVVLVP